MGKIKERITETDDVIDVHHIHLWSIDGQSNFATMHVVTSADPHEIKHKIREELAEHGVGHATLELESENEHCDDEHCHTHSGCGHHHGHHHH